MNAKCKMQNAKWWLLVSFLIFNFTFYIPIALAFFHTDTGQSGLAPLSEGLREEILSAGQQAALVGIGQEVFEQIDIRLFAMRIVRVALSLVGITLIAFLLYGGFLYMTSQGNEEKVKTAQKVLGRAGVGTLLIIFSYGIAVFVTQNLQKAIYQQHLVQAQSCTTATGQATCCDEWNAYQVAQGRVPTLHGIIDDVSISEQEDIRARELETTYKRWKDCFEKAQEEAFSFGD